MALKPRLIVTMVAGLLGLVMLAPEARAASLSVNPTKIQLTKRSPRALLTVKNEGRQPVRVQLTAHAWQQQLDGQMDLTPTTDIVFFPSLLTLEPGQARTIRIGTTAVAAAAERSYRIFVEELPPAAGGEHEASAVRLYTRLGIPIFLQPDRGEARPVLESVALDPGVLTFQLANTGTLHFVPDSVTVKALDASGRAVIERKLAGWYVLAGGAREFVVNLDSPECSQLRSLAIEAKVNGVALKEHLATPRGTCRP